MSINSEILIIGKIPPPIGGVSIHVKRLLECLSQTGWQYYFYNLNRFSFFSLVKVIRATELVHLHSSSPLFRLLVIIICRIFRKKLISTIHGNLGRFNFVINNVDFIALYLTDYPLVLNKTSFAMGSQINSNTKHISAFIPPQYRQPLKEEILSKIDKVKYNHSTVFCTNASTFSFDKDGKEIYNIQMLVEIFKYFQNYTLIISDPSGKYGSFFQDKFLTKNILLISEEHSFIEVIMLSDVFIRATTTDGDSLSIKEALFYRKNVIASNCVNRPDGVVLFDGSSKHMEKILRSKSFFKDAPPAIENGFLQLKNLYHMIQSK